MTTKRSKTGVYQYTTSTGQLWRIKVPVTMADGSAKEINKRGFKTRGEAVKARNELLHASDHGGCTEPSKQRLGDYLEGWLNGLQLAPSTVASYRKNVRLHITPYLGQVPLSQITPQMLAGLYRKLEASGRQDGQGDGLSRLTSQAVSHVLNWQPGDG